MRKGKALNSTVLIGGGALLLFWGIYGVVAKIAVREMGLQVVIWSYVAGLMLLPVYFLLFKELLPLKLQAAGIGWSLATGLLGGAGTMILYLLLRDAPASVVIPISALYPVVTAIVAYFFLQEAITPMRFAGIALAVVAIWLLSA